MVRSSRPIGRAFFITRNVEYHFLEDKALKFSLTTKEQGKGNVEVVQV
jgi:hypothetical protein